MRSGSFSGSRRPHLCLGQAFLVQTALSVPSLDHAVEEKLKHVAVLVFLVREHPPGVAQCRDAQSPGKTKQTEGRGGGGATLTVSPGRYCVRSLRAWTEVSALGCAFVC